MKTNTSYLLCIILIMLTKMGYSQDNAYPLSPEMDDCTPKNSRVSRTERGSALFFDGVDDYIELANNTSYGFDASFTIEAWIKPDSMTEGFHTIAQKGEEWQLKVFATPSFYVFEFGINNNSIFSSLQLDSEYVIGKWIHLAGVIDQTTGNKSTILYVNGISGSVKSANAITSSSIKLKIGESFNGSIDEFRVWNKAQSQSEIRENKHLTSLVGDANIITYLPFNEGSGTLANDLFGGNNGTLTNMNTTEAWISSGAPVGNGISISKTETAGIVDYTGTGLSANYNSHSSASVIVSRISEAPNQNPNLFDLQYWIIERYGSGDFNADFSFTVDENLTEEDVQSVELLKLYHREENSEEYWDYQTAANTVDIANKIIEFNNVSCGGQFAICRRYSPDSFVGNTLLFDGIDDHSDFGNSTNLDIENNLTIECWLKAGELNKNRRILCKGDNYFFEWDDEFESISGKGIQLKFPALNTGWWEFQYDMNYNQWYHIAFTYAASGELKAFINGYNVRTAFFQGKISSNTSNLILASNESESPFWGQVDELRIWNKVRSQQEIRENMCSTLSGLEQGLVGYWQFNESVGDSLPDLVGGNYGQLVNMSNSSWESSTAPLPFTSAQNGNWCENNSWLTGQNYPDTSWMKVKIDHDITLECFKEIGSLKISSTGSLTCTPAAQLTVNDNLSNENGIQGLALNSNATNTASLIANNSDILASVETYVSAGQWHFVSPPISSATVHSFYFPGTTTSWMKWWDEVLDDWVYIIDENESLNTAKGYAVYLAHEKSDETIEYTGTLNTGDKTISLDYSGTDRGFNLIGNPYPSPLDWDTGSWIKDQTTGIAYMWDNGNYISRNSIGEGSLTDGIIPSGQGFFVQTTSSETSITIPQDARVHHLQSFYKNTSQQEIITESSYLEISVFGDQKKDKTWVSFNERSTNNWDKGIDALRLSGEEEQPQLYTQFENQKLSIQSFEPLTDAFTIPLYFEAPTQGTYALNFKYLESFADSNIWLEDQLADCWHSLSEGVEYSFSASKNDDKHRFNLHFYHEESVLSNGENARIWYSHGQLNYVINESLGELNKIEVINLLGQFIYSEESPKSSSININKSSVSSYVLVILYTQNAIITQKVFIN